MRRLIQQLADWVWTFITPTGRHRAECPPAPSPPMRSVSAPLRAAIAPTVRAWYEPIDGTSTRLVRPYLTAHESEEKARLQRLRRDILWCATYGVDLDTRDIHACLRVAS